MKLGLVLPQISGALDGGLPSGAALLAFAQAAEAAGLDSLWLVDHFYWEPFADLADHGIAAPEERRGVRFGAWECWTTLAAVAAVTTHVELGTLVTNTAYRNPALLAHMAETVDELSNGRLILGLGAGDYRSEHAMHGYPWERRVGRFEEALGIIRPLLRGETVTHDGEFYQLRDATLMPKGPRPVGPPIMIGVVHGGPRMLRLVTQYADEWNGWLVFGDSHAAAVRAELAAIDAACARHGRGPQTLRRHVTLGVATPGRDFGWPGATPLSGVPEALAVQLAAVADTGVDHVTLYVRPLTSDGLDWIGEVVERLRDKLAPGRG